MKNCSFLQLLRFEVQLWNLCIFLFYQTYTTLKNDASCRFGIGAALELEAGLQGSSWGTLKALHLSIAVEMVAILYPMGKIKPSSCGMYGKCHRILPGTFSTSPRLLKLLYWCTRSKLNISFIPTGLFSAIKGSGIMNGTTDGWTTLHKQEI